TRCVFASSHAVALPRVAARARPGRRAPYLYEESKLAAERLVRSDAASCRPRGILPPCPVRGPGVGRPDPGFFPALPRGRSYLPRRCDAPKRLAYVGNLCYQLVKLLDGPGDQVHGRPFYLADYETTTLRAWAELIADRLGTRRPRALPGPL